MATKKSNSSKKAEQPRDFSKSARRGRERLNNMKENISSDWKRRSNLKNYDVKDQYDMLGSYVTDDKTMARGYNAARQANAMRKSSYNKTSDGKLVPRMAAGLYSNMNDYAVPQSTAKKWIDSNEKALGTVQYKKGGKLKSAGKKFKRGGKLSRKKC